VERTEPFVEADECPQQGLGYVLVVWTLAGLPVAAQRVERLALPDDARQAVDVRGAVERGGETL
jgi:hypothetical protein